MIAFNQRRDEMKIYLIGLLFTGCLYVAPSEKVATKQITMDAMFFHIDSVANIIDTIYIVRGE